MPNLAGFINYVLFFLPTFLKGKIRKDWADYLLIADSTITTNNDERNLSESSIEDNRSS